MESSRFVAAVALTAYGCASGPSLTADPDALDSRQVCQQRQSALQKGENHVFDRATEELESRGFSVQDCYRWIEGDEADKKAKAQRIKEGLAVTALALGVAALAVSAARQGGYGSTQPQSLGYDYQWDWDLFFNEHGQLVAACRGVQTGQFADNWRCNGKAQTDWRWPGK